MDVHELIRVDYVDDIDEQIRKARKTYEECVAATPKTFTFGPYLLLLASRDNFTELKRKRKKIASRFYIEAVQNVDDINLSVFCTLPILNLRIFKSLLNMTNLVEINFMKMLTTSDPEKSLLCLVRCCDEISSLKLVRIRISSQNIADKAMLSMVIRCLDAKKSIKLYTDLPPILKAFLVSMNSSERTQAVNFPKYLHKDIFRNHLWNKASLRNDLFSSNVDPNEIFE